MPATKKAKAVSSETNELVKFLEQSREKYHDIFERIAEKEAERELESKDGVWRGKRNC